jgi:hypothetical protein
MTALKWHILEFRRRIKLCSRMNHGSDTCLQYKYQNSTQFLSQMDHCHTIKLKDKLSPEDDNQMFMETLKQP